MFEVFKLDSYYFCDNTALIPCFPIYFLELEERDVETAGTLGIRCNSEYIHENLQLHEWHSSISGIILVKNILGLLVQEVRSHSGKDVAALGILV